MKSNKTLLIIFLLLLIAFAASELFDRRTTRSFDRELIALDTSEVTEIKIFPKNQGPAMVLSKASDGWRVLSGDVSATAAPNVVKSLLGELVSIKPRRIVSKDRDKFPEYGVSLEEGTRVEVRSGSRKEADFVIGRFNFNQQTRQPLSYVRRFDEEDTYVVEGFLGLSFDQSFESFRDKTIIGSGPHDWITIIYKGPEQEVQLHKNENLWSTGEASLDSLTTAQYISKLQTINGTTFDDSGQSLSGRITESLTLVSSQGANIEVTAYLPGTSDQDFVIHSSANNEVYFTSDSSGVYKTVFLDLKNLIF